MHSFEMTKISSDKPGGLLGMTKEAALPGAWKPGIDLGRKLINYGKNLIKPVASGSKPGMSNTFGKIIQGTGNFVEKNIGNPQQGWQNFGKASKRMVLGGGAAYLGYKGLKEIGEETVSRDYDTTLRNRLGAGLMDPAQVPSEKLDELYGVSNKTASDAFFEELQKHAMPVMPIVMGGLYGVDTLSKVKDTAKKVNPANAVGNTVDLRNYPEH